ncbi:hypothetical protein M5K25_024634 [Dendrobium thyrsiflorum]|uniref:Uncharacterized protein n=1 Tax=Dendrobium thyrsiflorum TaxID=117978 RepID=A0ABD0U2X6_DENTH
MKRKLYLISWANNCKTREKGGLGLPSFRALQYSFNCSLIFRIYNMTSPLSKWLFFRYTSPWCCHIMLLLLFRNMFVLLVSQLDKNLNLGSLQISLYPFFGISAAMGSMFSSNACTNVILNYHNWAIPATTSNPLTDVISLITIGSPNTICLKWVLCEDGNFKRFSYEKKHFGRPFALSLQLIHRNHHPSFLRMLLSFAFAVNRELILRIKALLFRPTLRQIFEIINDMELPSHFHDQPRGRFHTSCQPMAMSE